MFEGRNKVNCEMARLPLKSDVLRALFARSGNQCAFPGCNHPLISEKGAFIAQICHIEAANEGGPRYNEHQTDEERRAEGNLLLLCYRHHKETDDVAEYTVQHLQGMKKRHGDQFNLQYELPDNLLDKVLQSIEADLAKVTVLSEDTNTTVHLIAGKLEELLKRVPSSDREDEKQYIAKIEFIKELKSRGNYQTAINQLIELKEKDWEKLSPPTKYRVLVNLGMWYLDLHEKTKASQYLMELRNITYETPDSLALLCMGYALAERHTEFDDCFPKAKKEGPENVNLWIGYIERYKKVKSTDTFLKELPAAVVKAVPITYTIGGRLIEEGHKKEGFALLKQVLERSDDSIENKPDIRAQIATRMLQDTIDPFKFIYDHFSNEEYRELEEAKALLTEAWNVIGPTEMARYKWYVILNRGVINKVIKQYNQAVLDFQKAFELSGEFLAFKNLVMMYLQVGNLPMAGQLLEHPGIDRALTPEEQFEMVTFRARLLCLQQKFKEGIGLLEHELNEANDSRAQEIMPIIIGTCFECGDTDRAEGWCKTMINRFPKQIESHLFSGKLYTLQNQPETAMAFYLKAESMLTDTTRPGNIYTLASGFMDLEAYEKAIPLFERLADKNRMNTFSRGLISAYYQFGDLQAALALAENLFAEHPEDPFLVEIISAAYRETKQYDKAIAAIETFIPKAKGQPKDLFSCRLAKLYFQKRDGDNTRKWALQVEHPELFTMKDAFLLAGLLVKAGEDNKALAIAFDTRTRFFENSEAHMKYNSICLSIEKDEADLFPAVVRTDCAVTCELESSELKTFLITAKPVKADNVLLPDSPFAQQLTGKAKGETVITERSFGLHGTIKITGIIDIYTYAFHESLQLFETQFAGQQPVGVFHANPGQPGDQLEQIVKKGTLEQKRYEKQVYQLYNRHEVTIGVLAMLCGRNAVIQWFNLSASTDVSLISFTGTEVPAVQQALNNPTPIVLDLIALLTLFFVYEDAGFLDSVTNEFIVSQSTIDELQEAYDELEHGVKDGIFSMGYEDGQLKGHNVSKETIQKHRAIIQNIIQWCRQRALVTPALRAMQVKRGEREQLSNIMGACFHDTLLLAQEYQAAVLSDDDNFKQLLRNEGSPLPFSTYQLLQYLAINGKITPDQFELLSLKLVFANYICIPLSGELLWKAFDASGFKMARPFTVAVKGYLIMQLGPTAQFLTYFLKKLYLESGLATTREQTVMYIFNEIATRKDFDQLKKLMIQRIQIEFTYLPTCKDDILELLSAFSRNG
jgi:tetratricopeptide (TPR) repeat protein